MTQAERRLYLITELLKEDKGSAGFKLGLVPGNEGGFVIPDDEKSQRDILRALMNIRGPYSISEDFLRIQDEYLQQVNKERGITVSGSARSLVTRKLTIISFLLKKWSGNRAL